jgi:hypothetical protein
MLRGSTEFKYSTLHLVSKRQSLLGGRLLKMDAFTAERYSPHWMNCDFVAWDGCRQQGKQLQALTRAANLLPA